MKPLNLLFPAGILLCLSSCMALYGPTYFGSEFTPTRNVDVFYAAQDVRRPFEVIGHMNASTGDSDGSRDETRELVIQKARQVGADAVIFAEINRQTNHKTTDDLSVKVDVIRYKKTGDPH
ncbi:hypothetical protein SAMN06265348_102241 [Pedobacter westerhofensis]|uniref:Uncharacterized protein n=1 Tax=Pedobacter westerhofensis TaxID=425512 RepID=A0A521BEJ3_9SPHI|nr:hypothetical protein [Pedobacter westerhofensis]SMO45492.1 hypothetical protein SAMN06265348_102241 [Pedobacter westerhofensis]